MIAGVIGGVRTSERSTVAGVIRGIVWGIGSRSKIRSVVGCEGKGTFWGGITRVAAAAIRLGKRGYFSKCERLPWRRKSSHASRARSLLSPWNTLVRALCLARCASKVTSSRWYS